MPYKAVLFDLDGTLINSEEGVTKSIAHALSARRLPYNPADLSAYIGPPLTESFARYTQSPAEIDALIADYRARYESVGLYENVLYPGIKDMLCAVKAAGYVVALATSKPEPYALHILEQHAIAPFFDFVACATLDRRRNDKEEVIAYALANLPFEKKDIVMVGDRKYDFLGARHHGIDAIGVLYGFGTEAELSAFSPIFLAQSPAQLAEYFTAGVPAAAPV